MGKWIKSTLSFANGNCAEVTDLPDGTVGVRNSRFPDGPVLSFTPAEWQAFLGGARAGEFDRFGATPAVVSVRRLYVYCSLPAGGADGACWLPADSAVLMENGEYEWRCGAHEGLRRPGEKKGPVCAEVPAAAMKSSPAPRGRMAGWQS